MADQKIGTLYFEAQARLDKAEKELAEFRTQAITTGETADRAGDKIGTSFDEAGTRIQQGMDRAEQSTSEFNAELRRLEKEAADAREALAKLERQIKKTDKAADQAGGGAAGGVGTGLVGGLKRADKAATGLQGVLGKILLPVALVASIKGLRDGLKSSNDEGRDFVRRLEEIGDAADRASKRSELVSEGLSDSAQKRLDVAEQYNSQIKRAQDELEGYLRSTDSLFSQAKIGISDLFFGGDHSRGAAVRETEKQIERLEKARVRAIRAARTESDRELLAETERMIASLEDQRLSEIERVEKAERESIERIMKLREEATDEATRNQLTQAIAAVQMEYAERYALIERESQLAKRLADDRQRAEIEAIEERAVALERSLLSVQEQNRLRRQDEIEDVRERIDALARDGVTEGERKQIEALQRLESAIGAVQNSVSSGAMFKGQSEALTSVVREGVRQGASEAFRESDLLDTPMTLYAIRQNMGLIMQEIQHQTDRMR